MKTFFIQWIKWFLIINLGITVVVGISVSGYDSIPALTVFRIVISALFTSLLTTAFFSYEPRKRVGKLFGAVFFLLHYICLFAIMTILGTMFGWFELSLRGILSIAISVGGVYFITVLVSSLLSKNEAAKMNEALKKLDDSESE